MPKNQQRFASLYLILIRIFSLQIFAQCNAQNPTKVNLTKAKNTYEKSSSNMRSVTNFKYSYTYSSIFKYEAFWKLHFRWVGNTFWLCEDFVFRGYMLRIPPKSSKTRLQIYITWRSLLRRWVLVLPTINFDRI